VTGADDVIPGPVRLIPSDGFASDV
jgi:hypothetical protein